MINDDVSSYLILPKKINGSPIRQSDDVLEEVDDVFGSSLKSGCLRGLSADGGGSVRQHGSNKGKIQVPVAQHIDPVGVRAIGLISPMRIFKDNLPIQRPRGIHRNPSNLICSG